MRYEYKPNEIIIDRAIELWKRVLGKPKYDNGGDGFASMLASMLSNNANEENLNEFGKYLKEALMNHRGDYKDYFYTSLHVDYGPEKPLSEAAEKAGLNTQFPWKTSMYLYNDHVSFSYGYGGESMNHYPLSNGKWLMTTLDGSDITKVIEYVEGGFPTFVIGE